MYGQLFKQMLLEDWRMHSTLFGGVRFAFFPVQIAVIVAVSSWLVTLTTIDPVQVVAAVHALVFFFGVQIGSVAFEGADAMENVLGDVTYVMFSARTLPVSQRTLLALFFVKDLLYYSVLFILPITLGLLPLYLYTGLSVSAVTVAALFAALTVTFVGGTAVTVLGIGLTTRGVVGKLALGVVSVAAVGAWVARYPVGEYTPYRVYAATGVGDVLAGVLPVVGVIVAAVLLYAPGRSSGSRTRANQYRCVAARLPLDRPGLTAKTLLDVHRSSGGFIKVGAVAGVLFAVTVFLTWGVESVLALSLNSGVAFGALLSLTAFTTHMWLTQLDDPDEYLFQPTTLADVFRAKYAAFALVTLPLAVVFYGGALLYRPPGLLDAVVGLAVFAALSVYVFGVVVYLAGLEPNNFMFNTTAFTAFSVAIIVALLPLLLASFLSPLSALVGGGVAVWSVALGSVGVIAAKRAPGKWSVEYQ